jgi:hypothetical protein
MRTKYWIALTLTFAILAMLLVSGRPGTKLETPAKPGDLCGEVKTPGCIKKDGRPGQMLLEGMSRQFIFINLLPR